MISIAIIINIVFTIIIFLFGFELFSQHKVSENYRFIKDPYRKIHWFLLYGAVNISIGFWVAIGEAIVIYNT